MNTTLWIITALSLLSALCFAVAYWLKKREERKYPVSHLTKGTMFDCLTTYYLTDAVSQTMLASDLAEIEHQTKALTAEVEVYRQYGRVHCPVCGRFTKHPAGATERTPCEKCRDKA